MLVFIASCFVEFIVLAFALIIFRSGLKEKLNRSCFFFLIWIAIAILFNYLSNTTSLGHDVLLIINRLLFLVSLMEIYSIAGFVTAVAQQHFSRILLNLSILMTILVSILSVTPLVVNNIVIDSSGSAYVGIEFGPMIVIYFFTVFSVAIYAIVSLILGVRRTHNKRVRSSSKTLLLTLGVAIIMILTTNVILPVVFNNLNFSTLGPLLATLAVGGVGYSVARHGLFDIRLAVVRSVTYSLVLVTLAGLYLVAALAFSALFNSNLTNPGQMVSGVVISLLLAFVFQPIKRFFDKVTNRIFYKDNYNSDDFFARLNKTLGFTTNLRGLLERTAYEIGHTLKSEQTFFFVNTANGHYVSAGTENHKQLPKDDADQLVGINNKSHGVIVASLREANDPIRRLMLSHRIELILPLIQADETIGYLCLGEHLTSGYTNRDMRVLSTISDELTIAIQNALAVQEIRELNATLQQRISNATKELRTSNTMLRRLDKAKDEFVSMASHQLRTPLTSVKGYISMVIEGDAGKITDSQKGLLDEAFNSSERMVHLINDFLNVSRIQTGKFIIEKTPVDLSKVIEQEIDSLQPNAIARNLKFTYHPPKDFPMIDVDESKIRQVIMNFADNALYYSHENTTINISLSIENNEVLYTVKDNGIGVPSDEQAQLFSKFYRASNARKQRPDGTGVGLYLAKKVIDAHGGEVVFASTEGKGSTFGFRLPINN